MRKLRNWFRLKFAGAERGHPCPHERVARRRFLSRSAGIPARMSAKREEGFVPQRARVKDPVFFPLAQPFTAGIGDSQLARSPINGASVLRSVCLPRRKRLGYRNVFLWQRCYRNCLGGGGGFCESSGPFKPVSDNISLIVPTLESMLAVSTGMKITFALLLLVMSRKLSM